jgi:glycosyltransferase involved in cell wall biosynthesis
VRFAGAVLHSEVREMMAIADLFLQTNDVSCLGTTLLEALVCGRAIVTWDVGATRDVIADGQNGCLLPDAEPPSLARAVVALARDPARRERLAQGARRFALERLQSWDERLDMEIDLVEQIRARSAAETARRTKAG